MRVLSILFALFISTQAFGAQLTVGILAPQGSDKAFQRWQPFVDMLSDRLDMEVIIYPISAQIGTEAFFEGYIDLLLGNPVQTAVVVDTMAGQRLVSMIKPAGDRFAGVVVVRADSPIKTVSDLRGRRFAALGDWAAGGYLFQAAHFQSLTQSHPDQVSQRLRADNQNDSVKMVMAGEADAAFIRTGVLENLISTGAISEDDLRVLDEQANDPNSLSRTTNWYPEWYMVAQATLSSELTERLRDLLLSLDASDPGMQHAGITGFKEPLDIGPVINAMQNLGVAPYN